MGNRKGNKNQTYTTEFKLKVVKMRIEDNLKLKEIKSITGISSDGMIANWCRSYIMEGPEGLKNKKKGNPYNWLYNKKPKSHEEALELENFKLRVENERLKKGYIVKGGGSNKEYVSIQDANMKSLKN